MSGDNRSARVTALPSGTVTLLLGDIEGSTRAWERDPGAMRQAIARLNEIVDAATRLHGGVRPVEQGEGDSFVLAVPSAADALDCALDLQLAFAKEPWPGGLELRVRMALHTGDVTHPDEGSYNGTSIIRCARLRDLGHGGQTLMSRSTFELVAEALPPDVFVEPLGTRVLRGLSRPEHVYHLKHPDLPGAFSALDPAVLF